jgi:hypothetical protein
LRCEADRLALFDDPSSRFADAKLSTSLEQLQMRGDQSSKPVMRRGGAEGGCGIAGRSGR